MLDPVLGTRKTEAVPRSGEGDTLKVNGTAAVCAEVQVPTPCTGAGPSDSLLLKDGSRGGMEWLPTLEHGRQSSGSGVWQRG